MLNRRKLTNATVCSKHFDMHLDEIRAAIGRPESTSKIRGGGVNAAQSQSRPTTAPTSIRPGTEDAILGSAQRSDQNRPQEKRITRVAEGDVAGSMGDGRR